MSLLYVATCMDEDSARARGLSIFATKDSLV